MPSLWKETPAAHTLPISYASEARRSHFSVGMFVKQRTRKQPYRYVFGSIHGRKGLRYDMHVPLSEPSVRGVLAETIQVTK